MRINSYFFFDSKCVLPFIVVISNKKSGNSLIDVSWSIIGLMPAICLNLFAKFEVPILNAKFPPNEKPAKTIFCWINNLF